MKKIILISALIILLSEKLLFPQEVFIKGGVSFDKKMDEELNNYPIEVIYNPNINVIGEVEINYSLMNELILFNTLGFRIRTGNLEIPHGYDFNNALVYNTSNFHSIYIELGLGFKYKFIIEQNIIVSPILGVLFRSRIVDEHSYKRNSVPYPFTIESKEFKDNTFGFVGDAGIQCEYNDFIYEISINPEFYYSLLTRAGSYKHLSFNLFVGYKL
ncbi:MAG: hypothetical protein EHM44_05060 [Ignavibacteriales bacterium]|nr:MAG: hypothetical protein EHM44_05060 [Ignavibacteriales bacterium]